MKEKDKEPGYYLEFDRYRGQTLFFPRDFIGVNPLQAGETPQGRRLNRDADAGEKISPDMLEPQGKPEFITDMQALKMKDGDLIVLKTPRRLSQAQYKQILDTIDTVTNSLDINCRAIILEEGLDIGVLRKEP